MIFFDITPIIRPHLLLHVAAQAIYTNEMRNQPRGPNRYYWSGQREVCHSNMDLRWMGRRSFLDRHAVLYALELGANK